jgi:hypothetical protein
VPSLISVGDYNIIIADTAGDNNKSEPFVIVSTVPENTVVQSTGISTSSQPTQITSISTISPSLQITSTATGNHSNTTSSTSNVGSIVGEVVGGVAVLALIIGGVYLIHRHSKNYLLAEPERLQNQDVGQADVETMPAKMEVQYATVDSRM